MSERTRGGFVLLHISRFLSVGIFPTQFLAFFPVGTPKAIPCFSTLLQKFSVGLGNAFGIAFSNAPSAREKRAFSVSQAFADKFSPLQHQKSVLKRFLRPGTSKQKTIFQLVCNFPQHKKHPRYHRFFVKTTKSPAVRQNRTAGREVL